LNRKENIKKECAKKVGKGEKNKVKKKTFSKNGNIHTLTKREHEEGLKTITV